MLIILWEVQDDTKKEVWDNLFDCIESCNVFLQGNIYENKELLDA